MVDDRVENAGSLDEPASDAVSATPASLGDIANNPESEPASSPADPASRGSASDVTCPAPIETRLDTERTSPTAAQVRIHAGARAHLCARRSASKMGSTG